MPNFKAARLGLTLLSITATTTLQAKTTLITAATGAFGRGISMSLVAEGHDLVVAGRNQKKLNQLKKDILYKVPAASILTLLIDFSEIKKIKSIVDKTNLPKLDGVVLIGPRPHLGSANMPAAEQWVTCFKETFVAPLELVKAVLPSLKEEGSIVVISGKTSVEYLPGYPNTNVIRLAWTAEVKNLTHILAPQKIRVNAVSPGLILTQHHIDRIARQAKLKQTSYEALMKQKTTSVPRGSYGGVEDVAGVVGFLLSDKSAHVNGTNIVLDGGQSNSY